MGKIYAGDIGTEIRVDIQEDLTEAVLTRLKVRKPDGTEAEWEPSVTENEDGLLSVLRYITVLGDIPIRGVYKIQPYVEFNVWKGSGESVRLDVAGSFQ